MAVLLVNVDVPDLPAATRFYCDAFELRRARALPGAIELIGANANLYLLERPPGSAPFPNARVPRDYSRHWTSTHLDWLVDDIDTARERAHLAGAQLEGPIVSAPYGKLALCSDPFGNGFCLLQFSDQGYDAIAISS